MDWPTFWAKNNPIYVSERHKHAHYSCIAEDLISLIGKRRPVLLDYGCGEFKAASRVAQNCEKLYLYDGSPLVRQRLSELFSPGQGVVVLSPPAFGGLADQSIDIIVVNSVIQYLSQSELNDLLRTARQKLRQDGLLVLGDVIPPGTGPLTEVTSLLRFALRHQFVGAAAIGICRTLFSEYSVLRAKIGLAQFEEEDILFICEQQGFVAKRRDRNIGHNQRRMTFLASIKPQTC